MSRPASEQPTPAELELLKILWEHGPASGREVLDVLAATGEERAYTSVTSLLNVMTDKGFVTRTPEGRAFRYTAAMSRDQTQRTLLRDLLGRAFEGSAESLVATLLGDARLSADELDAIRAAIEEHKSAARRARRRK